jgi:hypothetical protein
MSRARIFSTAILAAALALSAPRAEAQSESSVTAAGNAVLPSGASFGTVTLKDIKFGIGAFVAASGAATGDVESTLHGTSTKGKTQTITMEGKPTTGSARAGGPGNLAGTCTVDMGDGTPPLSGVPFALTVSSGADGKWTMLLTLGDTHLPPATVNAGSVTVR